MKRDVYKKLMSLQSPEADLLLESKFEEISKTIHAASDNDTIYKQLEALDQFVYKVSDKTVKLATYLLNMQPIAVRDYHTKYGNYKGKAYDDVVSKALDLLNHIRYYQTRDILPLYYELFSRGSRKPLEEKIRDLAHYDLEALKHIGYSAQLDIIDFLSTIKPKDDAYIAFLIAVAHHLVNTEGESHSMTSENTLVFGFAPLPYNDDLAHVRGWLLDELARLLQLKGIDLEAKLKLVDLLNSMTHGPHRGEPTEALVGLINENAKAVIEVYRSAIFDASSVDPPLPLALEVEEKLTFMKRGERDKQLLEDVDSLIADLHKNYAYRVYRAIVGDKLDFFSREYESYEAARDASDQERATLIQQIKSSESDLVPILALIASFASKVEGWKLQNYYSFLSELADTKPAIAYDILEKAQKDKSSLVGLAGHFLLGFRKANASTEYEKTLQIIVEEKVRDAVRLVCIALSLGDATDKDLDVAKDVLHRSGRFSFIEGETYPDYLHSLTAVLAQRLGANNPAVNKLFIELLNFYEEQASVYLGALEIGTIRREIQLHDINEDVKKHLLKKLILAGDFSFEFQELALELSNKDASVLMDIFVERIRYHQSHQKLTKSLRYDAIPYHLNSDLTTAIANSPKYPKMLKDHLAGINIKQWSLLDSELSELFRKIGGYKAILLEFIRSAKKEDLKRVLYFYEDIHSADLDIAFAIVAKTDDKKIWSSVRSRLYTTGVVSGEYGLANAHQKKHDEIKEKYADSKNTRIRKFAEETLVWLTDLVRQERQRTEEELRLRKVEFEH